MKRRKFQAESDFYLGTEQRMRFIALHQPLKQLGQLLGWGVDKLMPVELKPYPIKKGCYPSISRRCYCSYIFFLHPSHNGRICPIDQCNLLGYWRTICQRLLNYSRRNVFVWADFYLSFQQISTFFQLHYKYNSFYFLHYFPF